MHPREAVKAYLHQAKIMGVRRRRRRMPRQKRPTAVTLAYFQVIKHSLDRLRTLVRERLAPRLEAWAAEFRRDAASDDVDQVLAQIAAEMTQEFSPNRLKAIAEHFGQRASEFQKEELRKQIRAALGVDILAAEPNISGRLRTFAAENAALIKTIPTQALSQIEALTLRAVQAGTRHEEIATAIEERFEVAESRAALIARDQVQKLAAAVDRDRQEGLGVTRFTWRTALDERVRDSHAELDGEVFSWDALPMVDGELAYPGSPINCRCVADPVLDDLSV